MSNQLRLRLSASGGIAIALSAAAFLGAANAEQPSDSKFDITAGLGAAMRPTYLGSDRYRVSPIPLVSLRWNDMVALGPEGLRLYWHHDAFTAGVGLTFDGGRDEKDPNSLGFGNGDSRLKGMGKIDAAIGYQAFIAYQLGMVELSGSMTKYEGSQNDGLRARFGAAVPLHLTRAFMVKPHVEAQWANDSYMQTFFGVSAQQATTSQFAQYSAKSGLYDVTGGLTFNYVFSRHWFAMSDVSASILTGDARNSPLTYSKTGVTAMTAIGYRF